MEFKLLESEDLISISSFGVHVWTVNTRYKSNLLYYWVNMDIFKRLVSKTARQALIEQISFLNYKFDSKNTLPSPYFDQLIEYSNYRIYKCTKLYYGNNLLEYYMKDISILKLNGKELIHELIQRKKDEQIKISQPYLSSAILKITECVYNLEEKINDIDKNINERFNAMSKEFKNLAEKIVELTGPINNKKS
ncbi:30664_t:CDS:2 [Gigaspora margarita]|uniref:30664_t:CDS:1 n=1 Tax=Gigaspora margarita TaxID=4874 RepID=A0ABN7W1S8_GIGMA|nr:30664_t:CDS:2 [Gigaspora margarita]